MRAFAASFIVLWWVAPKAAAGDVILEFRLDPNQICPAGEICLDLYAKVPAGQPTESFLTLEAVLQWDAASLGSVRKVDIPPQNWLFSGFWPDSEADGLNDDLGDGDAYYWAWVLFGQSAEATPEGLPIVRLCFELTDPTQGGFVAVIEDSTPLGGQYSFSRIIPASGENLLDLSQLPVFEFEDCNHNNIPDICDIIEGTSDDLNANGIPDECEVDCNGNGELDYRDIANGTSQDCNFNHVPDECDIDPNDPDGNGETSADCQPDSVPDECQLTDNDCNENGIPDDCDIASCDPNDLACQDCNGNGVPDACDITFCDPNDPSCQDCDGNGVPDACDITSCDPNEPVCQDCNENGIPDACDIVAGTSTDLNFNGIPDECEDLGDLNCDGWVNNGDIDAFVFALSYPELYADEYPGCDIMNGDINGDGWMNNGDIDAFVTLLSAQ